ncbi:MAG TPA: hypothetical protein VFX15_04205 [Actinomycetes bacterium]|nr:hypothetical protein [Actinomycetes bacterium]
MAERASENPFSVLMVCTGNIGRSPMMERVMRHVIAEHGAAERISVSSAGTWAQPGSPMEPGAAAALRERGIDPDSFSSTPLSASAITASDLVLVATREHRSEVVQLAPAAVRRTFTLRELERIVVSMDAPPPRNVSTQRQVAGDVMREAVAWAAQLRGSVERPARDEDDDLPDPLGAPDQVYVGQAAQIAASVERIVPYLLGAPSAG